jgi:tetratricopeptide (TPR) repeat protein
VHSALLDFNRSPAANDNLLPMTASQPPRRSLNLPPLIIAAVLLAEVIAVQSFDYWVLRQGLSRTHAHALHKIKGEIDARFQQGVLMLHAKQYEHAMTAFHRVLQLEPKMPEAHVNMGFSLLGMNRNKEATDFFTGALALRPEQTNAYYGLALAAWGAGNRQEAMHAMYHFVNYSDPADPYRAKAEDMLLAWKETPPAAAAAPAGKKSAPAPRRPAAPQ